LAYMKDLYKQAADKKSKGVQKLVADKMFGQAYTLATTTDFEHPKLDRLVDIIDTRIKDEPHSKIIIFAQFRETVSKISNSLNKIEGITAKTFVGQTKKEHGDGNVTGLNQKEQKEVIEEFSRGDINALVATSIAEEGLDIPEVNEVIFYEPVPSAIRTIQRAGRTARLMKGSLKIMMTKNTRDMSYHYAANAKEKKMHKAIGEIKGELDGKDNAQKKLF